jgi:hypothetical protein
MPEFSEERSELFDSEERASVVLEQLSPSAKDCKTCSGTRRGLTFQCVKHLVNQDVEELHEVRDSTRDICESQ